MLEIAQDTTPTIVVYPSKPMSLSTATVRVGTPAESMPDTGVAATVDTSTFLLASAAEAGDEVLQTDATFGSADVVPGRQYGVLWDTGPGIVVEVVDFTEGGGALRLAQPLPCDIPVTAIVVGHAVSITLTAEQTASLGIGSAEWAITAATDFHGNLIEGLLPFPSAFRVVKRQSHYDLTWSRLTRYMPDLEHQRPAYDDTGDETIEAAWLQHVVPALLARNILPGRINNQGVLVPAHVAAVRFLLMPDDEGAEREFYRKLDQALASRGFWYDEEETLVAPVDEAGATGVELTR